MHWVAYVRVREHRFRIRLDADRAYTIGRSKSCDIRVNDTAASRRHCMLAHHGEGWRIVDLGSKHGFRVGDAQTREHLIGNGDRIGFGHNSRIRFKLHDAAEAASVPEAPLRKPRRVGLAVALVVTGAVGFFGHRYWNHIDGWIKHTFASDEASLPSLAELEEFVRDPDSTDVGRLFALDDSLYEREPKSAAEAQEYLRLSAALLQALLAAVRSGDERALDHLIERADRLGVVEGLFRLGPGGVRAVLDATDDARIDPLAVAPYLEKIRDPSAFPRLQQLLAKPDAQVHLRLLAFNVLATHDAPPTADELRRLVAAAKASPRDRGQALLGERAAMLLAKSDPEYAGIAREFSDRRKRRHEAGR